MDEPENNSNDSDEQPEVWLKSIFIYHFIFSMLGGQGSWCPQSYLFYNLIFFMTLLWSMHHKKSSDPVMLCSIINSTCIVLDVIVVSIYFPGQIFGAASHFSVAMAILNLFFRPLSCYMLYIVTKNRMGTAGSRGLYTAI